MDTNLDQKLPIDAVILWVNGNDKKHQDKILKFVKDKNLVKTKAFRTRYDQVNEIKYTIDSLLKFAPFIRKIHLITDNQIPDFLTEKINNNSYNKVFIVDHKKVFDGYHKHTPHPLRKSTFETFFNDNRDVFINNIKHKFRSIDQFTPQGLANHIEIKNNSCVLEKDLKLIYFRSYKKPLFWYNLNLKFKTNKKLFLGLQSLDKCPSNKLKFLLNWLSKRLKI